MFQRYRATQELGKGSFGTVYLAEGRVDQKKYVVKVRRWIWSFRTLTKLICRSWIMYEKTT